MLVQPMLSLDPNSKNTTLGRSAEDEKPAVTRRKAPKRKARPKRLSCAKESSSPVTPPFSAGQASGGNGVASIRRQRKVSYALSKTHVSLLVNAIRHTHIIGCPLNRFVTIDWDLAGVDEPWKAQGRFLKYIRDWLACHGCEFAYVWIMERGSRLGLHSHMLLHIPPQLMPRMRALQQRWLKHSGVPRRKNGVDSRSIGHSSLAAFAQGEGKKAYDANLQALENYVLKAAGAAARSKFNITGGTQYSPVVGKRAGTSRNLGKSAIAEHRKGLRKPR